MNNIAESNIKSNLRVLLGALVFIIFGIFATSKRIGLSIPNANIMTQILLYLLVICSLAFRGYYFKGRDDSEEFIKKYIMFSMLLLPNAVLFLSSNLIQLWSFMASFIIAIVLCLEYQIKVTKNGETNYITLFLLTIWTHTSALILFNKFGLIPVDLIQNMEFLRLDILGYIRLLISILLFAILLITAIADALHNNPIWGPYHVNQIPKPEPVANRSGIVELLYIFIQPIITAFINPVLISLFCNLILFGIIRISIDFILRVCRQLVMNIWHLVNNLFAIIYFLVLYIIGITIFYVISITSEPLLEYMKGMNDNIQGILLYLFLIIILSSIFKVLITILFTKLNRSIDNSESFYYIAVKESLFSNTTASVVASILIWLSSGALWSLSIYNILQIEGFNSIGVYTRYYSYFLVIMMIIAAIIYNSSKGQEKEITEDKPTFIFDSISWSGLLSRSWIYVLFMLFTSGIYYYSNGSIKAANYFFKTNDKSTADASPPLVEKNIDKVPPEAASEHGEGSPRISVYTTCSHCPNMRIYIDNEYIGTVTEYFTEGKPDCGVRGTVAKKVTAGGHIITATDDNGNHWETNINVDDGACFKQNFSYNAQQ